MSRQIIKLGEAVRSAWEKVNANFLELFNNMPTKTSQLTNDSGFLTATDEAVVNKVDKETGKGLSTNDYTTAEKSKLAGIAAGAQVNVVESVKVNGTALSVSGKAVNIDLSAYAKKSDIASAYNYKGSKATVSALPTTGNTVGDVWNVETDGMNYAWTGTNWDPLGGTVDLSGYATTEAMNAALAGKVNAEAGKGLSSNDFTNEYKEKLNDLAVPSTITFTVADWGNADSDGYYTRTIQSIHVPFKVMRKNGNTYEEVIVQMNYTGSAIVLISEEAFEGYVLVI